MAALPRAATRLLLIAALLLAVSLSVTSLSVARPGAARAATTASAVTMARKSHSGRLRLKAWHYAMHQHGKPYSWGGAGPGGFDCSGLVYASYRSRGVHLPRTTYGMLGSWHLVRIRKSRAHRGDLAFFGSGHVELFDHGKWTFGAQRPGTRVGFHRMSRYWHPTMYFRVRR